MTIKEEISDNFKYIENHKTKTYKEQDLKIFNKSFNVRKELINLILDFLEKELNEGKKYIIEKNILIRIYSDKEGKVLSGDINDIKNKNILNDYLVENWLVIDKQLYIKDENEKNLICELIFKKDLSENKNVLETILEILDLYKNSNIKEEFLSNSVFMSILNQIDKINENTFEEYYHLKNKEKPQTKFKFNTKRHTVRYKNKEGVISQVNEFNFDGLITLKLCELLKKEKDDNLFINNFKFFFESPSNFLIIDVAVESRDITALYERYISINKNNFNSEIKDLINPTTYYMINNGILEKSCVNNNYSNRGENLLNLNKKDLSDVLSVENSVRYIKKIKVEKDYVAQLLINEFIGYFEEDILKINYEEKNMIFIYETDSEIELSDSDLFNVTINFLNQKENSISKLINEKRLIKNVTEKSSKIRKKI